MKKIFVLLLSSFMIFTAAQAQDGGGAISKMFGMQTLPDMEIETGDGEMVNVQSFAQDGKITVLTFFALWCGPCKKELSNMAVLYDDWKDMYDVEIVAISIDDFRNKAKVKSYVDGQGWDYTVLMDVNSDLKRALGFQNIPATVLLNQEGQIVHTHNSYVEGDEYILEEHIAEIAD